MGVADKKWGPLNLPACYERWAVLEGNNVKSKPGACIYYNKGIHCTETAAHEAEGRHRCVACETSARHPLGTTSPFTKETVCPRFAYRAPLDDQFWRLAQMFPGCSPEELEEVIFGEKSKLAYRALGVLDSVKIFSFDHLWANTDPRYPDPLVVLKQALADRRPFDSTKLRWCRGGTCWGRATRCLDLHIEDNGKATARECPDVSRSAEKCKEKYDTELQSIKKEDTSPTARDRDEHARQRDLFDLIELAQHSDPRAAAAAAGEEKAKSTPLTVLSEFVRLCLDEDVRDKAMWLYETVWRSFTSSTGKSDESDEQPPFFFAILLAALSTGPDKLPSWVKPAQHRPALLGLSRKQRGCLVFNRRDGWCYKSDWKDHRTGDHFCFMCGDPEHGVGAEDIRLSTTSPCRAFMQLRAEWLSFLSRFAPLLPDGYEPRFSSSPNVSSAFFLQQYLEKGKTPRFVDLRDNNADALVALAKYREQKENGEGRDDNDQSDAAAGGNPPAQQQQQQPATVTRDLNWYINQFYELADARDQARGIRGRKLGEYCHEIRYVVKQAADGGPVLDVFMWCIECCQQGEGYHQLHPVFRGFKWETSSGNAAPIEIMVKTFKMRQQAEQLGNVAKHESDDLKKKLFYTECVALRKVSPHLLVGMEDLPQPLKPMRDDGRPSPEVMAVATRRRDKTLAKELAEPKWSVLREADKRWQQLTLVLKLLELAQGMFKKAEDAMVKNLDQKEIFISAHSDIKPMNICLDRADDGRTCLDFIDYEFSRVAKMLQDESGEHWRVSTASVSADQLGFGFCWASPLQISSKESRPSSDMFSLALVIYDILHVRPRTENDGGELPLFFCDDYDEAEVEKSAGLLRSARLAQRSTQTSRQRGRTYDRLMDIFLEDVPCTQLSTRMEIMDAVRPRDKRDGGDFDWWRTLLRPMFEVALEETTGKGPVDDLVRVRKCIEDVVAVVKDQLDACTRDLQNENGGDVGYDDDDDDA